MVLFFAHIPFVVNRTFNATPTERLQHMPKWFSQGRMYGGIGEIAHLKPAKVNLLIMIVYISENSIRDIRLFCRPLFCHSSVLKYTASLLL